MKINKLAFVVLVLLTLSTRMVYAEDKAPIIAAPDPAIIEGLHDEEFDGDAMEPDESAIEMYTQDPEPSSTIVVTPEENDDTEDEEGEE